MMRRMLAVSFASACLLAGGCAAILGGGTSQAVSLSSAPTGASFVVKSSSGIQMAAGKTPETIRLPRKNEYQVEFSVPGYHTQSIALTKALNGWVWGNFVFGWIPGFIVDFVSGSAYKLEPALVQIQLQQGTMLDGSPRLYGVVQQLSASGRVLSERRVLLEPVR